MGLDYHHFIITRFNVNITPRDFPPRLEDAWLSERFDLFTRYCFPTVRAQTCQDFHWLVLLDEKTPTRYRALVDAFARYANLVPVYCGGFHTVLPLVMERMGELAPGAGWLVTTRLDNDDGLATGFVQCLHGVVDSLTEDDLAPEDTLYINFPNGLQFYQGEFYDFKDMTNAFVSLVERAKTPHTVFWVDHPSIHDVSPVVQASTDPLWLQVVHGMNVYNYLRGERVDLPGVERLFPCDFPERPRT